MTKTYGPWKAGPLARILATPAGKVASHWLVQGMTYMDPGERRFRLGTETAGTLLVYGLARGAGAGGPVTLAAAALAVHTADFAVNGQLLGALKWHWRTGVTPEQLEAYAHDLGARVAADPSVRSVLAYGSLARGELRTGSDLDLRVLRRPGLGNAVRASAVVARERFRGQQAGVPMDIYAWDSVHRARDMRADEVPVLLGGEPLSATSAAGDATAAGAPSAAGTSAAADARTAGRVAFLRGARTDRPAGATDVEVIPALRRLGWTTLLVAVGPRGSRYRASLDTEAETAWAPRVPALGALVANLHAIVLTLRWRPEVIVVNPGMALAGAACALLAPAASVVTDVRSVPVEVPAGLRGRLANLPFRLACHLPRLRGLTAITPGTLAVLRRDHGLAASLPTATWASGAREDLFHPGVTPLPLADLGLPAGVTPFIYHGQLTVDRGLPMLLDAFATVRAGRPDAALILLGDGPAVPALRERAAAPDLRGAVALIPGVPVEVVPHYLATAAVGVIPLPDLEWWRISSPMKLYEYLATGLAVVATDIEAHRGIPGVRLCEPTAAGLAAGMLAALDERPRADSGSPAGAAPASAAPASAAPAGAWSWDRQARRLSDFLVAARHG